MLGPRRLRPDLHVGNPRKTRLDQRLVTREQLGVDAHLDPEGERLPHILCFHLLGRELGPRRHEGDLRRHHVLRCGVEQDPRLCSQRDPSGRRRRQKDDHVHIGEVEQGQDLSADTQHLAGLRKTVEYPSVAGRLEGAVGDIDLDTLDARLCRLDRRLGRGHLDLRRP
jgi:hypothetical protein